MKRRFLKLIDAIDDATLYTDPEFIVGLERSETPLNTCLLLRTGEVVEVKHTVERLLELIECEIITP